jgi:hypothetical protein
MNVEYHKFGLLQLRQWKRHDHLVVLGINEATERFFTFGTRQLREYSDTLDWGLLGTHNPERRMRKIIHSIDRRWLTGTDIWYQGSVLSESRFIKQYHLIGMKSFSVPMSVFEGHHKHLLSYKEIDQSEFQAAIFPVSLSVAVEELRNRLLAKQLA